MIKKEYLKMNLKDLVPYEKNIKKHGKNIQEIKKSIEEDSYIAPIIVDEDKVIIAWHGRTQALLELWRTEEEVIMISWLTDLQKKRYRIKDNKLSEISPRDMDNLEMELKELMDLWDMETMEFFDLDLWVETPREEDENIAKIYEKDDFDHWSIKTFILHFTDGEYMEVIENLWKLIDSGYWEDFSSVILRLSNENITGF